MPVNLTVVTADHDDRLSSFCVTAKCSYADFLSLTLGAERNLDIQRAIIKGSKAYATLRSDLKRGCVLPPVVLAVTLQLSQPIEATYASGTFDSLNDDLSTLTGDDVYVIDGLQRTNAIRQTAEELGEPERTTFLARSLRVELWVNISFGAIAYRMLLLNAGQRPMSVRHQVEVLSSKLVDDLGGIAGLDIFRISETRRRTQPGQFPLSKVAQAFQAWLQGQPNLDLRNVVMEELLAESAIEVLGQTVPTSGGQANPDGFHRFMTWLVALDLALGQERVAFLGNETVLLGVAAAVGALERSTVLSQRVWPALNALLEQTRAGVHQDPVGVLVFDSLRSGIDVSKVNVGIATRDMVFNAFKEYIRAAGEVSMQECWTLGAARD